MGTVDEKIMFVLGGRKFWIAHTQWPLGSDSDSAGWHETACLPGRQGSHVKSMPSSLRPGGLKPSGCWGLQGPIGPFRPGTALSTTCLWGRTTFQSGWRTAVPLWQHQGQHRHQEWTYLEGQGQSARASQIIAARYSWHWGLSGRYVIIGSFNIAVLLITAPTRKVKVEKNGKTRWWGILKG